MVNILQQISKTRFQATIVSFEIVCLLFCYAKLHFLCDMAHLVGQSFLHQAILAHKWSIGAMLCCSYETGCANQLFWVILCGIEFMVAM